MAGQQLVVFAIITGICLTMVSCDVPPGRGNRRTEPSMQDLYDRHRKSIEAQLAEGRSWIRPNEGIVAKLARYVSTHRGFFRDRVAEDFFVAEWVLRESDLAKEHAMELDTASVAERKEIWLELLAQSASSPPQPD